jgi:hypothetical protein
MVEPTAQENVRLGERGPVARNRQRRLSGSLKNPELRHEDGIGRA